MKTNAIYIPVLLHTTIKTVRMKKLITYFIFVCEAEDSQLIFPEVITLLFYTLLLRLPAFLTPPYLRRNGNTNSAFVSVTGCEKSLRRPVNCAETLGPVTAMKLSSLFGQSLQKNRSDAHRSKANCWFKFSFCFCLRSTSVFWFHTDNHKPCQEPSKKWYFKSQFNDNSKVRKLDQYILFFINIRYLARI